MMLIFCLLTFLKSGVHGDLDRYVETVPLAGQVLDVRESQKLKIIEKLKLERQRVRFEAEIGKTPPLSDEELAEHMQHEA
jgi:hypothetical protein